MKSILPLVVLVLIALGFFFFFQSQKDENLPQIDTVPVMTGSLEEVGGVVSWGATGNQMPVTQLIYQKFGPMISETGSFETKYKNYIDNKDYLYLLIESGDEEALYNYAGLDYFPGLVYLCEIFQDSEEVSLLKEKMYRARGLLFISGATTYGGEDNVNSYNKIIEDFSSPQSLMSFSTFYSEYKTIAKRLLASNIDDYGKRIGEVVVAIYALGEEKFMNKSPLNCEEDLNKLFKGKNLNP